MCGCVGEGVVLLCETIPCAVEAEALAELCEEQKRRPFVPDRPWVYPFLLSFSCRPGNCLASGESLAETVQAVRQVALKEVGRLLLPMTWR